MMNEGAPEKRGHERAAHFLLSAYLIEKFRLSRDVEASGFFSDSSKSGLNLDKDDRITI